MVPAALGALGAEALTLALLRSAQGAVVLVTGTFPFRSVESITVVAYAVATLFAFGSGRWRGVAAAVLLFAVIWSEQFALSIPGNQLFCERSGTRCDLVALAFTGLWPQVLGIALGIVLGRALRQGTPRIAALAVGVGIAALAFPIARLAIVPLVGPIPSGTAAQDALSWVIGAEALGAAALGLVAGRFGRRTVVDGLIIAGFYLGPWLPQIRVWLQQSPPGIGFVFARDWQLIVPIGYVVVALLGLAVGARVRDQRAVRTPTTP